MKYGVGRWTKIALSECLPTKNIQQMYLQSQRLFGQQSMAEFVGCHLDIEAIYLRNLERRSDTTGRYQLKHGLITNMGDNFSKKEIAQKRLENIRLYGLSHEYYMSLKPPKATTKDWLKVLSIDQIMRDKTRFSVS